MSRTAILTALSLALLAVFAAIALSVVNVRRPLRDDVTRSFGTAASRAAGTRASVAAVRCRKVAVAYYGCSAAVTPRSHVTPVYVHYNVWLDDNGCWDTKRRTPRPQPAALGPLRSRFYALRGCIAR